MIARFGAFTALYARDEPYGRRAAVLAGAAAGLVVSPGPTGPATAALSAAAVAVAWLIAIAGALVDREAPRRLAIARALRAAAALAGNRAAARHLEEAIAAVTTATGHLPGDPASAVRLALLLRVPREAYDVAAGELGLPPGPTERVLAAQRAARTALTVRSQAFRISSSSR